MSYDAVVRPDPLDRRLWLVKPMSGRAKALMEDVLFPTCNEGWYCSFDPLVGWMIPLCVKYEDK